MIKTKKKVNQKLKHFEHYINLIKKLLRRLCRRDMITLGHFILINESVKVSVTFRLRPK